MADRLQELIQLVRTVDVIVQHYGVACDIQGKLQGFRTANRAVVENQQKMRFLNCLEHHLNTPRFQV